LFSCLLSASFSVSMVLSPSQDKLSLIHKPICVGLIDWKYICLNGFCFMGF
jgi:hypothetical protein